MIPGRDAVRVLFRIAFRNLAAAPVRTAILGAIVLVGSMIVVVGSSLIESIDRGMRTSIQGSLGGHVQVYDARSEDTLSLYARLGGEPILEPIEDFSKVKAVLAKVPNVRQVVPMGIHQAMVSTPTTFDAAVERLREDVRRMEAGDRSPASQGAPTNERGSAAGTDLDRQRLYRAHVAHVRRMLALLGQDLTAARAIADLDSREIKSRSDEYQAVRDAGEDAFWARFEKDRYAGLEFLENRVAPAAMENAFTFIRYAGTDPEAFFQAFPLAEVREGERIPPGRRGILVGKQFAEEWLKLKNARRLDEIKDQRDRRGKRIAKDEELRRWVKDNRSGIREILLQLDPVQADELARELRAALRAPEGEALEPLLQRLFATTDEDFDEKYRVFYAVVAPRIRLYKINVGDVITVKAPSKSGYFSSVNVKVYGFLSFRGIERSRIAGMISVMDLMSFRDLYGYMTKEKAEEIRQLKTRMAAKEVDRENAEAELFGSASPAPAGQSRAAAIDDAELLRGGGRKAAGANGLADKVYGKEEIEHGVALNAALILDDSRPSAIRRTMKDVEAAVKASGLPLAVIDWQAASGLVGQFVTLLRIVLVTAVVIFFGIALVVINNAMVMATLQRVKEIGTMRAIGTQRRFVVAMLLVEITAVGILFGLGGAVTGGVVVAAIRAAGGIPAVTDLLYFMFSGPALFPTLGRGPVGVSLAVVILVAILSALYPAFIAMKVTPVEAMATDD